MSMKTFLGGTPVYKAPAELEAWLREKIGDGIVATEFHVSEQGLSKVKTTHLWVTVKPESFLAVIDAIGELDFPHYHVGSGNDDGDTIRLNYHFSLYRCMERGKEMGLTVVVSLPKSNPVIPSLYGRIPGVEYSEREMAEMLGVKHTGLPFDELLFLPDGWDRSILPWRRDDTGPEGKGVVNRLE